MKNIALRVETSRWWDSSAKKRQHSFFSIIYAFFVSRMLVFFVLSIVFMLAREYSGTYALSGILPQKIRRGWIKKMYYFDYINWRYYDELFLREFPYYKLLNAKERSEFMVRTIDNKNYMHFEAREDLKLDDRKLALLSASMTQLTFGFNNYRLYRFEKIIIYPGIFYSKFLDANVKGLTYGTGYVYLSWSDFEDGYKNFRNKLNLGLHEFAHALMLQKPGHFETYNYDTFTKMAEFLMNEFKETGQPNPLFRDYGFSNLYEFWAVCVEVFFEQPREFFDHYPRLYKVTCTLLKQDMMERMNVYILAKRNALS